MTEQKPKRERTEQERYPDRFFTSPAGHPRDRIKLHESKDIPQEGLFLALNGFSFLAKPGVEIDLPRPVRQMLDTRIITVLIHGDDGKAYSKDISRVPYTLIKENVGGLEPETAEA